jgi:hypothetical protein
VTLPDIQNGYQSSGWLKNDMKIYKKKKKNMSTIFLMEGFPEYNVPGGRISRVQFS